jgi:pimeloyl-ACP methyl ester carboxylesterase
MPLKIPENRPLSCNDQTLVIGDGTRIAYRIEGHGPALILTNGLTTTTTFWQYLRPSWLRKHRVLTWDLPGHGASGPAQTPATASVPALPGILRAVMDAAGVQRGVHVGWSTGSQVVLEMYRQQPEACDGLVLLLGAAGHVLDTTQLPVPGSLLFAVARYTPTLVFSTVFRGLSRSAGVASYTLGRALGLVGERATPEHVREIVEHIASVDPGTLQQMLCSVQTHSAHDVLARAKVPMLIVAGDADPFAPSERVGLPMHAAASHSQLLRLPRGTHTAMLEEPALIAGAVERFCASVWAGATDGGELSSGG